MKKANVTILLLIMTGSLLGCNRVNHSVKHKMNSTKKQMSSAKVESGDTSWYGGYFNKILGKTVKTFCEVSPLLLAGMVLSNQFSGTLAGRSPEVTNDGFQQYNTTMIPGQGSSGGGGIGTMKIVGAVISAIGAIGGPVACIQG